MYLSWRSLYLCWLLIVSFKGIVPFWFCVLPLWNVRLGTVVLHLACNSEHRGLVLCHVCTVDCGYPFPHVFFLVFRNDLFEISILISTYCIVLCCCSNSSFYVLKQLFCLIFSIVYFFQLFKQVWVYRLTLRFLTDFYLTITTHMATLWILRSWLLLLLRLKLFLFHLQSL